MDFSPLDRLKQGLANAQTHHRIEIKASHSLQQWVKNELRNYRLGPSHFEPIDRQRETIAKLKNQRHLPSLKEARWLAFGLSLPLSTAPCLLEDFEWFDLALQQINAWRTEPRRFRKCYQGLLHSYFSYDGTGLVESNKTPEAGLANWRTLRTYLQEHLNEIQTPQDHQLQPEWVQCLQQHPELLSDQPGAFSLAQSHAMTSAQLAKTLAIPRGSWFSKAWALIPLHQALSQSDEVFCERLPELIELIENHPELHDGALRSILNRCGMMSTLNWQMPPHTALREHCANHWGSPWLPSHQEQWKALNIEALDLMKDWFKLELIELFFNQLSDDRAMRDRKTVFWQKHFKRIDSLHLALGSLAMNAKEPAWSQVRQKTMGFTVEMADVNPRNNALILAIGQHMAIEMAGTSDDFCHYEFGTQQGAASPHLKRPQDPGGFNSKTLRENEQVTWLTHKDHVDATGHDQTWETTFETLLDQWQPIKGHV